MARKIADVIKSIDEEPERPKATVVKHLAGLHGAALAELGALWPTLAAERRLQVIQLAADIAEDAVDLDFSDLFRLALDDSSGAVRVAAVEALWEDEDFRTAGTLVDLMEKDADASVREAAAMGLRHFALLAEWGKLYAPAGQRVRAALLDTVGSRSEGLGVRRRAVEALGVFSGDDVVEVIERAYADPDAKMRASAIFAMGQNADERWIERILAELGSDEPELRFEAARAAGELGTQSAVPRLVGLLDDQDREVTLAAIGALGQIGGAIARRALQSCARSKDAAIAGAAEDALEELSYAADPLTSPVQLHGTQHPN